jgi:N12 class adenine-specific DNA methylase
MNLNEFRAIYPQYDDMRDEDLSQALHSKYYSDIPYDQFTSIIGLTQPEQQTVETQPEESEKGFGEQLLEAPRNAARAVVHGALNLGESAGTAIQYAGERLKNINKPPKSYNPLAGGLEGIDLEEGRRPLSAGEEAKFQGWYKEQARKTGIDPNPDDPRHKYDYRSAYKSGAEPQIGEDGKYHWPSEFKADDHPNRYVDGIDTITGEPTSEIPYKLADAGKNISTYFGEMAETGKGIPGHLGDMARAQGGFGPPKEIANKNIIDNPELLGSPSFWAYNVPEVLVSLAASMVPAIGTYRAVQIGGKALKMTPAVINGVAKIGASLVGGAAGGALEATQTYKQVLSDTGNEVEAARAAELMGFFVGGLNAISTGNLLTKAAPGFLGKVQKFGLNSLVEGITEGAEEPAEVVAKIGAKMITGQEIPENIADLFIQSLKEAATIAPIAAVTGGLGGMVSGQGEGIDLLDRSKDNKLVDEINSILDNEETDQTEETEPGGIKTPQDLYRQNQKIIDAAETGDIAQPYTPPEPFQPAQPAPTGEVPGMGVDKAQQEKEIQRGLNLAPSEQLALPPGQGFELLGDQPAPYPQPDQYAGMEKIGTWEHDPIGDYWKAIAMKEGLALPEPPADTRDLNAYWERIRKLHGLEEESDQAKPALSLNSLENEEFRQWEVAAAQGKQPSGLNIEPPVKEPKPPVEKPKPPTLKEKALKKFNAWAESLSEDDRAFIANELEKTPKRPSAALNRLKNLLEKRKTEQPKEQEAWQMSRRDFQLSKAKSAGGVPILNARDGDIHRNLVKQALNQGHDVPKHVLKDYPELQEKPKTKFPAKSVMGTDVNVSMHEEVDGVSFELYKPEDEMNDKSGFTLVRDVESGNILEIKKYPTIRQATDAHIDRWSKALELSDKKKPKKTKPANKRPYGANQEWERIPGTNGYSSTFGNYVVSEKSDGQWEATNQDNGMVLGSREDFTGAAMLVAFDWDKRKPKEPAPTKKPEKSTYGTKNKLFTKDAADAARELLRKKLGQVNVGLDPEIVQAGIQLAGYHIEAGARKFGEFAAAMVNDLGSAIKPYLRGWYEAVRYYPGFDSTGMTDAADINEKDLTDTETDTTIKTDKEEPNGTIREPTEGPPEGTPKEPVSGSGKGKEDRPVLPGKGRGSRAGTKRDDSRRDARVHGTGNRNQEPVANVDYSITPGDSLGEGGPKAKYKDNVAAIRVLKELGPRKATPEEQAILVKYVGWGGLPQAFPKPNGQVTTGWQSEVDELQDILTPEEYDAARKSTQDAHYTSETVVSKIYSALKQFGFKMGKILEPSVGTGNFIGLMPAAIRGRSNITGIELDPTTAAIAEKLYPNQRIVNSGFEEVSIAPGSFDLAIGNPPFGDKKLFDAQHPEFKSFSIHNFFFAKSLVGLRPNGILSMVVSSSMMDKRGTDQRKWLAGRAELVGAIRLPNNAFKSNAGTEVTTDILFFRKLMDGEAIPGAKWIDLKQIQAEDGTGYLVNEYFADHPEMVLGTPTKNKLHPGEVIDGLYKGVAGFAPRPGVDLDEAIDAAISYLPKDIYKVGQTVEEVQRPEILVSDVGFAQPYGYTVSDDGQAVRRLPDVNGEQVFEPVLYAGKPLAGKRLEKFKGLLDIRDAVRTLIRAEIADESKTTLDRHRKKLNRVYDRFVSEYGYISVPANSQVLQQDPTDLPLLRSLEEDFDKGLSRAVAKKLGEKFRKPSAKKASIFTVRTREPYREATTATDAKEGLAIVLREDGYADMDRIAKLTGKTVDEVAKELKGLVYKNPMTDGYETSDIYLSGNVKKKLKQAMEAKLRDPIYNDNVVALEKVLPEDVPVEKIHVEIGATWVPTFLYEDFSREVLERNATVNYFEDVGTWAVNVEKGISPYDSTRRSAAQIFTDMVTGSDVVVYETIDKKRVFDREGTVAAQQKAKEINRAFQDWVLADADRREALSTNFNDKVNTTIDGKYDGSHMIFPGMGVITTGLKRDDQLLSHQKNVVWRLIQKGKGLVDHVVGSGKTFLSIASGIEMKRMGLLKKPMYVVPNHLVGQWAMDFQRLYPGANVLIIDKKNFAKSKRQEAMGRIATGEWDAVVVAHSSFGFIKMPYEYERKFYADQIAQYEAAIVALTEEEGKKSRTVKQMENAKDKLRAKMQALANRPKDATVDFSELGVDALFVDEAHEFKNLFYATKRQRVAGLGNQQGSQKAFDMFVKTQFISENNNGRGVFFMTGTPVSNSIAEMYTMMRYLDYDRMKEMGIRHFDQWANMFASPVSDWEVDPTGTRYRLQTKMDFVNIPGLMAFYRDFADVVSTDDLKAWAKERGQEWPIPEIKGGKPESVVAEKSDLQKNFMEWIVHRFDNMPDDPRIDNPLKATGEAMKGSLDIRLIKPSLPDHPGSKVNLAVKNITDTYEKWKDRKGTQLVFCDLSVPSKSKGRHIAEIKALQSQIRKLEAKLSRETDSEKLANVEEEYTKLTDKFEKYSPSELMAASSKFSVYDDVKAKLIANGIPEAEIAFIHDANTDLQKEDLFARVRNGRVRVLMGSTSKMGAGMNVQDRLVALHHLDAPWRPSDLEQREGRIIRQGNLFYLEAAKKGEKFAVDIYRYATKETLDTRRWQIIERKAKTIEQLRTGGLEWGETISDTTGAAANAAEMKAASSGNPLILEEIQARKEIETLELQRRSDRSRRFGLESKIKLKEKFEKEYPKALKSIADDVKTIEANPRDNTQEGWSISIDGKEYRAEGLIKVPEKYEGEDKDERKANAKAIKDAKESNDAAFKKAKADFESDLKKAMLPYLARGLNKSLADVTVTLRGVDFIITRTNFSDTIVFEPDIESAGIYDNNLQSSYTGPRYLFSDIVDSGLSIDGLVVRLNNLLDKIQSDRSDVERRLKERVAESKREADIAERELAKAQFDESKVEAARQKHTDILNQLQQETDNAPKETPDFSMWTDQVVVQEAEATPTEGYYEHHYEMGWIPAVGSKKVDIFPWAETFIRKQTSGNQTWWSVSEATTGLSVAKDKTRKGAIAKAETRLNTYGEEGLKEAIERGKEDSGLSPWKTGKPPEIIKTLSNDTGSSQLATDIYNYANELVQSGLTSFRQFRARVRKRFSDVYDKIKSHLELIWNILNNQRGEVRITKKLSDPPKKTKKAYKLFRTLKTRPGEIFPLFIGKSDPTPIGVWIEAKFIPTKGFAERPGWHSGKYPYAPHLLKKDGTMPEDRVWAEIEIPDDVDWQSEADKSKSGDVRGKVPSGGHYKFKRPGTQGLEWRISGAIKVIKTLTQKEVAKINGILGNQRGELNLEGLFTKDLPDNVTMVKNKGMNAFQRQETPPHWLAREFPEFNELYQRQKQRDKDRMKMLANTMLEVDGFMKIKGENLSKMRDLIFSLENVPPGKMKVAAKKFKKEDGKYILNDEYYDQYRAFLDKTSLPAEVKDAYMDLRKSLDRDLATVFEAMAALKDIDQTVLEQMRTSMGQIHNYFPHMRYGKYFVQALDPDGNVVYREHFDAPTGYVRKANRMIKKQEADLKKKFPDITWKFGMVERMPEEVFSIPVPIEAIEAVMNAAIDRLPDAQAKESFRNMLPQAVSDALKSRGWGSHMIKRKNIPGYETEKIKRVLFDYKAGLYGWITKMSAARDFSLAMSKVKPQKKKGLWPAMRQYSYDMLENSGRADQIVDSIRSIFFAKYLGLNVKTAALNTTQNLISGWPRLSMETGGSLVKVMRGVMSEIRAQATHNKNLPEDEIRLLHELYQEGITNSNFLNEVRGQLGLDTATVFNKTLRIMGLPMEVAERFNRCSLALAAYRAARDGQVKRFSGPVNYSVAKEFAETIVEDAHFVYGKTNRPEMFRGKVGKAASTVYTFRSFSHNLLHLYRWMLKNGGNAAIMRSMAATMAVGGLTSLMFYKTFMHAVRQLSGDEPEDELLEFFHADKPGLLRDMFLYGLPAGVGVSLGGSVGMEVPVFDKIRLDQSIVQQIYTNFGEILGIPGAIAEDIEGAGRAVASGNISGAFERILPTALANPIKAKRLYSIGQTSESGKPINLPGEAGPRKLSGLEAFGKTIGFQPVSSTKAYDIYRKIEDYKNYKQGKQKEFANRIMNAVRNGNDKARLDAVGDLVAWNKKQFEKKRFEYIITGEDINRSLKSRLKAGQPPTYLLPKAIKLRNKNFQKEN